ncbi:(2Fe-2S)-binding protein [Bacillus sp. 165]|nr:(2Fe-2S)-binding protein [Bacillus sp. 165]
MKKEEHAACKNMQLCLNVNDENVQVQVQPGARLVNILREHLKLTGTKISCGIGRCGACSVIMDGKLVNSCLVMAYQAQNASILTIEGIGKESLAPAQTAFLEEGGFQCGYCTPGMIVAVKALIDRIPNPSDEQIQEALSGNLCRCTGYGGIIRAVGRACSQK